MGKRLYWLLFALLLILAALLAPQASGQAETTVYVKNDPVQAVREKPQTVSGLVEWYADKNGAPQDLAYWVAWCESEFENVPNENGEKYGKGIYQFIQSTWDVTCEGDVWDVEDNIDCATKLLAAGETQHWGTAETDWGTYHCWKPKIST